MQKNLPKRATDSTSREAHKRRRQASWARAQKRKEARLVAQRAREKANRELVAASAGVELPAKRPSKQVRFLRRLEARQLSAVA